MFLGEILEFQGILERATVCPKNRSINILTLRGNKNKEEQHVKQDDKYNHEQHINHM